MTEDLSNVYKIKEMLNFRMSLRSKTPAESINLIINYLSIEDYKIVTENMLNLKIYKVKGNAVPFCLSLFFLNGSTRAISIEFGSKNQKEYVLVENSEFNGLELKRFYLTFVKNYSNPF